MSKLVGKTKEKKPAFLQKNYEDSKPQDNLHENFNQNVETFRSVYDNCSDVMFRPVLPFWKNKGNHNIYKLCLPDIGEIEEFVPISTYEGTN